MCPPQAQSTAMATRLNSDSVSGAISLRPNDFCARHSSGMAGPRGSSPTAARPIAKPSCCVMPRAGCRTGQDAGSSRSIRQSQYLNNRIEQDHRAVKRRVRSMLGFKSADSARMILGGIELIHMMRKQQAKYACRQQLPLAEQFHLLAAGHVEAAKVAVRRALKAIAVEQATQP
jgi:DDE domain